MAVREILHVGNPLLREVSRPVTRDELASPEVQQLIDDLIDTMHAANGAGIAAPQVGELVRIAKLPDVMAKLEADGGNTVGSSAQELRQVILAEIARYRKIVTENAIKLEE